MSVMIFQYFQPRGPAMGHPGGPLLCLDHRPPRLLPDRPLLPGPGDQEVPQETQQGRQQG